MRVAVIDGQGGGIGKAVIDRLRSAFGDGIEIVALATNAVAAASMLKAGANEGASGENAIVVNAPKVDAIIGSIAVIAANSMLGEITPKMAEAIASSDAKKLLIPLNRCGLYVLGTEQKQLGECIDEAVKWMKEKHIHPL
jgi:hypothetical protein